MSDVPTAAVEAEPCCKIMAGILAAHCERHSVQDCPDKVIAFNGTRYLMPIKDGRASFFPVSFCPFCGAALSPGDVPAWQGDRERIAELQRRIVGATDSIVTASRVLDENAALRAQLAAVRALCETPPNRGVMVDGQAILAALGLEAGVR